jgi:uncharacterized delta-60 repeat protein
MLRCDPNEVNGVDFLRTCATFNRKLGRMATMQRKRWCRDSKFWTIPTFVSLLWNAPGAQPIAGNPDPAFTPVVSIRAAEIARIALQPDGKILVNGTIASVGGELVLANSKSHPGLARLYPDGTLDRSFHPVAAGTPVVQPDGKILILDFQTVVRLNPDGSADSSFALSKAFAESVFWPAVLVQSDGRIIIADASHEIFDRLRPKGTSDPDFHRPIFDKIFVSVLVAQPDGKIIIGGGFGAVDGVPRPGLARLQANGELDLSFNPGTGGAGGMFIAIQPDGKVLVAVTNIVRLNGDGSLDTQFDGGPSAGVLIKSIVVQPDGKILEADYWGIRRFFSDGALDPSFSKTTLEASGFPAYFEGLLVYPDGRVLAAGGLTTANGLSRPGLARLNADGSLDADFDPPLEFSGTVLSALSEPDGKTLIGGRFDFVNGKPASGIARLNSDGSLDPQFDRQTKTIPAGLGPFSWMTELARQADGKIFIVGHFTNYAGVPLSRIARLKANGTLDESFDTGKGPTYDGSPGSIDVVKIQADGRLLVGGSFDHFGAVSRSGIIRLESDGSVDRTFLHGPGTAGVNFSDVRAVEFQSDGKMVIGGAFQSFDNDERQGLARLLPDGTLDAGFAPKARSVYSLAVQAGDKILVGEELRPWLTRLNADGSVDSSFQSAITNLIWDPPGWAGGGAPKTFLQPDGKILVATGPWGWNGVSGILGRLNSDGSVDATFRVSPYYGQAIALDPGGNTAVIGGYFWNMGGLGRSSLARVFLAQQPALNVPASIAEGFQVQVSGDAGRRYQIDRTVDLLNWTPVGFIQLNGSQESFIDPVAPAQRSFYRATLIR